MFSKKHKDVTEKTNICCLRLTGVSRKQHTHVTAVTNGSYRNNIKKFIVQDTVVSCAPYG